jgi:thioredoxin-related protein
MNETLRDILIGVGGALLALIIAIAVGYSEPCYPAVGDVVTITVITSSNCPWCDKFKERVLDDYHVQKALQKYNVKVSFVDIYDPSIREVVRAVPHVVFYKNNKKVCYFVGYKDKEEFLKYLVEAINA